MRDPEVHVKNRFLVMAGLLIVAGSIALVSACGRGGTSASADAEPAALASHQIGEMDWETGWEKALDRAKKEKKVVLVDFYADWCVWCRRLDATTYKDPDVVRFIGTNLIPVKLDVEAREGRRLAERYGVDGLPTILIVGANGSELGRIPGYMPASRFLETVQRYVGPGRSS